MFDHNLFRMCGCLDVVTENNGEPVDELKEGEDAEAKAKSKEATEIGDKVDQSHPLRYLVLCRERRYSATQIQIQIQIQIHLVLCGERRYSATQIFYTRSLLCAKLSS